MIRNKFQTTCLTWHLLALFSIGLLLGGCGEQYPKARLATNFSLPVLDSDQVVQLADYRGQVVYLTFWASWCLPCRQEMPYLAQLLERHQAQGFAVLAVNVDSDVTLARAFAADYAMPFPVLLDTARNVSAAYRIPGYPTHYLIDRSGHIRFSGLGFDLNDVRAVSQEVATLIAEPQPPETMP